MKTCTVFSTLVLLLIGSVGISSGQDRQFEESSYVWNPELAPSGPLVITVSLKSQLAAVYRNGIRIGSCEVSTGKPGHETPTGIFHILNKDADHHSKTYGNAAMPFSERLTWDGVALHAGGLPGYPSSHGCIHLPYEFSRKLFGITQNGTTVIITDESPDVHISDGHHVEFQKGGEADYIWSPEISPSGPVSLLFSSADKRLYVIRNGKTIGECPVSTSFFSSRPDGTSAFVFYGWEKSESRWVQVGGAKHLHAEGLREWFKLDERFQHLLQALLVPGTSLVVTNERVTKDSGSAMGFRVLQGPKEEDATKAP